MKTPRPLLPAPPPAPAARVRPSPPAALALAAALLSAGLPARPAHAQDVAEALSLGTLEDMSLEELLDVPVAIASRSAESTRMAASIITVIDRERIEREGARTLHEALKTAVGFDTKRNESNEWMVALRGYDTAANFLVMVDGHRVNSPYDGGIPWDLPLTNVRRIELIRGPGSAVYGSNAFVGAINVITFEPGAPPRTELRAWGWANHSDFRPLASLSQPLGGVALRTGAQLGKLRVDLHGTFREDAGDALLVPSDNASLRNEPWSLARCVDAEGRAVTTAAGEPVLRLAGCQAAGGTWNGRTHNQVRHGEGSLRLQVEGLEWTTRVAADRRGAGLGDVDSLSLVLADQSLRSEVDVFSQAVYTHAFGPAHQLRVRGAYDQRAHDVVSGLAPAGFVSGGGVRFPEGLTTRRRFTARDLMLEVLDDQTLTLGAGLPGTLGLNLGASAERRQVDGSSFEANFQPDLSAPRDMADATATLPPLYLPGTSTASADCLGGSICTEGRFVHVLSAWAQGRWQPELGVPGLAAALTAGVRGDRESRLAPVLSPRAGLTLTADDAELPLDSALARALLPDNVKVLYGSAFRSATIQERYDNLSATFYGNPGLAPERVSSLEAGLGYRVGGHVQVFANYFASDIRNSIQRLWATSGTEPLRQRGTRQVQGVELEVRGAGGRLADAYLNASSLRGTDTGFVPGSDAPFTTHLEDQPALRLSGGGELNVWRWLHVGLSGTFTGERGNPRRTPAESSHSWRIPPVLLLNGAVRLKEPLPGLTVQLYGRNLLGAGYRDPLLANHDQDVKLRAGDPASYLLPRERLTLGLELAYQLPQ
jgi:iron complex outermembrane receptor protein